MKSCMDCTWCNKTKGKCTFAVGSLFKMTVTDDTPICEYFEDISEKTQTCENCAFIEKIGMGRSAIPVFQCQAVGGPYSECIFTAPGEIPGCTMWAMKREPLNCKNCCSYTLYVDGTGYCKKKQMFTRYVENFYDPAECYQEWSE